MKYNKINFCLILFLFSSCRPLAKELSAVDLRQNFFKNVMGISEQDFVNIGKDKNRKYNFTDFIEFKDNSFFLKNIKTGQRFQAGLFEEYSIGKLREKCKEISKVGNGRFSVIESQNIKNSKYRNLVDIGALQADPKNVDAVFQIASNFSSLEPVSKNDYPESGITKYISDYTQGPFAVISAAPGIIYRMYYIFCDKYPKYWRQTEFNQINFLSDTNIPTENGYIVLNNKFLDSFDEKIYENIKVGYHSNIQVTSGFLNDLDHHESVNNDKQIINQLFTAAVDFGSTNYKFIQNKKALNVAQLILDAAYEGTIRSAIINNKKKVFLTLIGGGVFANSLSSIAAAICKNIKLIKDYGLEVTLIVYDSSNYGNEFIDFKKQISDFVEQTDGIYTEYKG